MATPSFRTFVVDHPDGRQTQTTFSATEVAQTFSAEAVARFVCGQSVMHEGKRYTDLMAFYNARQMADQPRPQVIAAIRKRIARACTTVLESPAPDLTHRPGGLV